MSDMRDFKERRAIIAALWNWIDSQGIKHEHAALILVQLAGYFIGYHAAEHNKDLNTGLEIIVKVLRKAAAVGATTEMSND